MARQTVTLHDVTDEQLFCMRGALGHQWEAVSRPVKEGQWGHRIYERCTRCSSDRTTIFNIYGDEAVRWYERPSGYIPITEPYNTSDVRLEYLRRVRKVQRKHHRGGLRVVS